MLLYSTRGNLFHLHVLLTHPAFTITYGTLGVNLTSITQRPLEAVNELLVRTFFLAHLIYSLKLLNPLIQTYCFWPVMFKNRAILFLMTVFFFFLNFVFGHCSSQFLKTVEGAEPIVSALAAAITMRSYISFMMFLWSVVLDKFCARSVLPFLVLWKHKIILTQALLSFTILHCVVVYVCCCFLSQHKSLSAGDPLSQ